MEKIISTRGIIINNPYVIGANLRPLQVLNSAVFLFLKNFAESLPQPIWHNLSW
jgi:hypothetical protein